MLDFRSSLLDLAVYRETRLQRKVFMDFNRNPLPAPGDRPFSLDRLDDDVRAYLEKSGALLEAPIDRLRKMNPLAIELYKRYKYDITRDPLEFAINNQHMNGGLAVDAWGRTTLAGCYAVGEAAGTHGVTRPGGAALTAGQVFGTRCAEHIASMRKPHKTVNSESRAIEAGVAKIIDALKSENGLSAKSIRDEIQARMSDHAGILCKRDDVNRAKTAAAALKPIDSTARRRPSPASMEALRALQWRQSAVGRRKPFSRRWRSISIAAAAAAARAPFARRGGDQVPRAEAAAHRTWRRFVSDTAAGSRRNRFISDCGYGTKARRSVRLRATAHSQTKPHYSLPFFFERVTGRRTI